MERGYWDDPNLTRSQRRDNWWRYHWLHVLCGTLAVIVLYGVLWERVHREEYDASVALVTRYTVTPEEVASLQRALEAACPDFDGDGRVRVAVNAIQIDYTSTDMDDAAIQVMTTSVDKLNSALLFLGQLPRSIAALTIVAGYLGLMARFYLFALPLLPFTNLWLPALPALFLIYPGINDNFQIEDQLREK